MEKKVGALTLLVLAAACALLLFPAAAVQGAKNGLGYSLGILVPSLYPFLVLSIFVVKSGISERMGHVLERPTRALFHLPGRAAATVLMSAVGGYPTGARSTEALYEEGAVTQEQAERMMRFCVNAGPSFVITAVGVGFLHSAQAGIILLISQLIAFFLTGLISGRQSQGERQRPEKQKKQAASRPMAQAFVESASDAAYSMLMMCSMVILFAALMNLLKLAVRNPNLSAILSSLLEVTGGCADLARRGVPLWVVSAAIGWGGVCVHFQIYACLGKLSVKKSRFVFWRAIQGAVSGLVCFGICLFFPETEEVFSNFDGTPVGTLSGSIPAAAELALLCLALLFSLPRKKVETNEEG